MQTQHIEQGTENDTQLTTRLPDPFGEAYRRRLPEILAVADEDLWPVNLDVRGAVMAVLGSLPEIRALQGQTSNLPRLDPSLVDALEDYALSTGEASARYVTAVTPKEDIVALNAAAVKQRDQLRTDALALASRGLMDPARLARFKGIVGYKNTGFELLSYANLFMECWPKIAGKTPVTLEEIHDAKRLGVRLVEAAGLREQAPIVVAEVARIRQRAFTLLMRAYDEVRRTVIFLRRRDGDADEIAPSLYAGRGGRKRPVAPPAAPALAPEPAAAVPAATFAPPAHTEPIAPGLPGANPFL